MKNPVTFRSDRGGHPDPETGGGGGGGRAQKNFLRPFRPQFGLKIEGAPLLDPPL